MRQGKRWYVKSERKRGQGSRGMRERKNRQHERKTGKREDREMRRGLLVLAITGAVQAVLAFVQP